MGRLRNTYARHDIWRNFYSVGSGVASCEQALRQPSAQ